MNANEKTLSELNSFVENTKCGQYSGSNFCITEIMSLTLSKDEVASYEVAEIQEDCAIYYGINGA